MSSLIQINILKRNDVFVNEAYGIDVSEICTPIRQNINTGHSYFLTNVSSKYNSGSVFQVSYTSSELLSDIVNKSTQFVLLDVIRRRLEVNAPEKFIFNIDKIADSIIPTLNGCKFLYREEGDPLYVEYEVTQTVSQIVAQTALATITGSDGITFANDVIKLGQTLLQVGDPAALNTDREIPTSTNGLYNRAVTFLEGFKQGSGWYISDDYIATNLFIRVNPSNVNGAGILESPPTYNFTPAVNINDSIVAVKSDGSFYNTGINPSDVISDKYYEFNFVGSVSLNILGPQHNLDRIPDISIYNSTGQLMLATTAIDYNTFDVTITFNQTQSGKIILT